MQFNPASKDWDVKINNQNQNGGPETRDSSVLSQGTTPRLTELQERQNLNIKKLAALQDIQDRLSIQAQCSKLIVADSIKDFHEQMQQLVGKTIDLKKVGPELLSINREGLALNLDISRIKPPTLEEEKEMELRISAKLSNLTSPNANRSGRQPHSGSKIPLSAGGAA